MKRSKKKNDKIKITSLTKSQIESEIKRIDYKTKYRKIISSTIYTLIIILAIASVTSTIFMPVFQINSNSMDPEYSNGDIVTAIKFTKIKQGDVIAFYHGNKILIKRVIGSQSDWIDIDEKGNVSVNGKVLDEKYVLNKTLGDYSIKFPYQVPNDSYFILSDDRENMVDSRSEDIGCVNKKDIIGEILFRVWPLK